MGAATTRKLFDPQPRLDDIKGIGPGVKHLGRVIIACSIKHFEKPLFMLECIRIGSKIVLGQEGGEQPVAGALSHV